MNKKLQRRLARKRHSRNEELLQLERQWSQEGAAEEPASDSREKVAMDGDAARGDGTMKPDGVL